MSERKNNKKPKKNGIATIKEIEIPDMYKRWIQKLWDDLEITSNIKEFNITEDQRAVIRNKAIRILDKYMLINDLQLHLTIRRCLQFDKYITDKYEKKIDRVNVEREMLANNLAEYILNICQQ